MINLVIFDCCGILTTTSLLDLKGFLFLDSIIGLLLEYEISNEFKVFKSLKRWIPLPQFKPGGFNIHTLWLSNKEDCNSFFILISVSILEE